MYIVCDSDPKKHLVKPQTILLYSSVDKILVKTHE